MTQAGDVAHRNGEDHSLGGRLDAGLGHDGLHDVLLVLGAGQDKDHSRSEAIERKTFGQFHTGPLGVDGGPAEVAAPETWSVCLIGDQNLFGGFHSDT